MWSIKVNLRLIKLDFVVDVVVVIVAVVVVNFVNVDDKATLVHIIFSCGL